MLQNTKPLFQEIGKRGIGMQIEMKLASESHVPRFRAGVGTWRSGYMIPIRLPWRLRARPSATLHEIQARSEERACPTNSTPRQRVRQEHRQAGSGAVRRLTCHPERSRCSGVAKDLLLNRPSA